MLLVFDCSSTVAINYAPLRVTVDAVGGKQLGGNVYVSGDMSNCGEYLARFDMLE